MRVRGQSSSGRDSWGVPLTLVVLALLAYLPALRNGFIWDDDTLITRNGAVTNPNGMEGLGQIWTGKDSPDYFPLTSTTFWVEYHLWGAHPAGFHLVNILLHSMKPVDTKPLLAVHRQPQ